MNKFQKIINFVFKTHFGEKKEVPPYPNDFVIIDYSPIALKNNIKNNQNKIIYRYIRGEFEVIVKKYRYSVSRLKALREIYNIPILDKTKKKIRFPVFAKILPSEVSYTK